MLSVCYGSFFDVCYHYTKLVNYVYLADFHVIKSGLRIFILLLTIMYSVFLYLMFTSFFLLQYIRVLLRLFLNLSPIQCHLRMLLRLYPLIINLCRTHNVFSVVLLCCTCFFKSDEKTEVCPVTFICLCIH